MRKYCRYEEAVKNLKAIIDRQLRAGTSLLPGEIKLAEEAGVSRMTLRKALRELEADGIIEEGARGRIISQGFKGHIVFVGAGIKWVLVPAWNRLWLQFEKLAAANGWRCSLRPYSGDSNFNPADFKDADFIVYTGTENGFADRFEDFARGQDNVIGVHEDFAHFARHIVALDNHAVGRVAARTLFASGYRKPACLRQDTDDKCFLKREEGFIAEIAKTQASYDTPRIVVPSENTTVFIRGLLDRLDELLAMDIDSLFVTSDELIKLIYDPFSRTRDIPRDFGLITLAGSHVGLLHMPPITSVKHGTAQVASGILELAERLKDGRQDAAAPSLMLVEPGIHEGATVRSLKES